MPSRSERLLSTSTMCISPPLRGPQRWDVRCVSGEPGGDVEGEDSVLRGGVAQHLRHVSRMAPAAGAPGGQIVQVLACLVTVGQAAVEVHAVGLRFQTRQQRLDGCAHVARHAEVDAAAPAQALRPQVHLRDPDVRRVGLAVGRSA